MKTKPLMNFWLLSLSTFLLLTASCTFDNEEEVFPDDEDGNVGCQIIDVSYQAEVVPILEINCYFCHDNDNFNSLGSGIDLEGYDDLKVYVDNGRFFGSINRDQGFSPMPRNAPKLDQCDLDKIKSWIDDGARNN